MKQTHPSERTLGARRSSGHLSGAIDPQCLSEVQHSSALWARLEALVEALNVGKGTPFCLLILNVDEFKLVNDSLGHAIGDRVLLELARRIANCLGADDIAARLGGAQFGILLPRARSLRTAQQMVARVQRSLAEPIRVCNQPIFVTVSIGIAHESQMGASAVDAMRSADTAMNEAKARGPGRFTIYEGGMHERATRRLRLAMDLRLAAQRNELSLHYQPIVSLGRGRLAGFEALLRWHHPLEGVISPAEFIPLAEKYDLISCVGNWALKAACARLAEWRRSIGNGDLFVSVNFAPRQIVEADFAATVLGALRDAYLPAQALKLEITETTLLESAPAVFETLQGLRSQGVEVWLDDFGIGYSAFQYLQDLPVDGLKIDGSFIKGMYARKGSEHIVRMLIGLAEALGMRVVAECVETRRQLEALTLWRCGFGQGRYLASPAEASTAVNFLKSQSSFRALFPPHI